MMPICVWVISTEHLLPLSISNKNRNYNAQCLQLLIKLKKQSPRMIEILPS